MSDEIEREVNRIWLECPGVGIKDLMTKLEALNLSSEIDKKRVKSAKQAIPYVRKSESETDSSCTGMPQLSDTQVAFVEQKIQERMSVRVLRRYKDGDEIMKGLTAMGVIIDDGMRTWTVGEKVACDTTDDPGVILAQQTTGLPCEYCGRYFASKNLVFRHLRDVSSSCGNSIFANGEKVPDAPSAIRKHVRQEAVKALRRKKTGKAKIHADPAATLWFGDLPIPYTRMGGQYKRLKAVLREYLPRDVPQPWIKKVVRKAYRKGGKISEDESERGEYFGYAVIVFRDGEEASSVKKAMDGVDIVSEIVFASAQDCSDIPSFIIKVKNVQTSEPRETQDSDEDKPSKTFTCGGQDPPLLDQLRPLSIPELQERCENLRKTLETEGKVFAPEADSDDETAPGQEHDKMLEQTVALYNAVGPRFEVSYQGRIVPESIRHNLLDLLKNCRWPAASHRRGLTSERYLVLQTNVANDRFYNDLREGCRELMQWVDPDYYYSGIAVTKNFVASPHIDDRDKSFQYAISLGDFTNGGHLCVEGRNYKKPDDNNIVFDYVNIVETHNRIARLDGRHVHWVRSWEGGDRYSLIFYDTSERLKTDIIASGVDVSFLGI